MPEKRFAPEYYKMTPEERKRYPTLVQHYYLGTGSVFKDSYERDNHESAGKSTSGLRRDVKTIVDGCQFPDGAKKDFDTILKGVGFKK